MSLTSGTRLGPYEILAPIGTGGMGEVYKANDTRIVAIKVSTETTFGACRSNSTDGRRTRPVVDELLRARLAVILGVGSLVSERLQSSLVAWGGLSACEPHVTKGG